MDYYFSRVVQLDYNSCLKKVTDALKTEGFGVITEIDIQATLKEKLGVEFKKYTILGACNPSFAYKALQTEEKIGTMLPCNIVILDRGSDNFEVSAVNPVASMLAVQNPSLENLAREVSEKLERVIRSL